MRKHQRLKGIGNIELVNGDSGFELGRIIDKINHATLFWLDGHFSGGETGRGKKIHLSMKNFAIY